MAKKGKVGWIPGIILDEVDDIMQEDDLEVNSEACKKLVKYARVGREVNRMRKFPYLFSKPHNQSPVDVYPNETIGGFKKVKKKKKGSDVLGGLI